MNKRSHRTNNLESKNTNTIRKWSKIDHFLIHLSRKNGTDNLAYSEESAR